MVNNSVDLVIGSEAIRQVQALTSDLILARKEVLSLSDDSLKLSKSLSSISTPSGLDKTVSCAAALNTQLEKQNAIITKLHADIAKKAEQSRLAEIRLQQQREKAFDSFEKNAQKEAALNAKNETAYQRIQNSVNLLTKTYQDLAIRKQLGSTLTAKEEAQLTSLTTRIKTYQDALLKTDATIGKNQRNVGNYASGFNSLGNSINQLSREMPAFANSMNTGFMALSNNYPALFDAINGIRAQNKLLVAEGKPTVSVLKSIAGAVFSWQTALSVGVTLLTLYGGKIVEWAIAVSKGSDGIKSLKENQTALNDAVKEGNKDASKEISQLDILYKTATNVALSTEQRLKAVNKLQETYPSYFADIDDEIIMNGKATKSYEALREAIFDSARAKAIQSTLETRAAERLDKEMKLREDILETETKLAKQRADPKAFSGGEDNVEIFSANEVTANLQNNLNKRNALLKKFREDSLKEDDLLLKAKEKAENKSAVLEADRIKEPKGKKASQAKAKRDDLDHLESYIKPVGTIVDEINKEIDRLTTEKIIANEQELPAVNEQLSLLLELKKQLNEVPTAGGVLPDFVVPTEQDIEKVKELSNEMKNYLNSFSSEFMNNSGFSETFAILNGEIEGFGENFAVTFNAIAESAQEVFNFISENSSKRFESERERLEDQYEFALKGAGDNKAAQEKLAEDLDKKKKEIANRENKAKQKQAIFNIAIDTAQAIMATLAKGGAFSIPLSVIVGAIGALQIGMVASRKIPQYFDGTDNHVGGMMLVNDGVGSNFQEKVILPNGKEIIPEGRNVLMNAPKGTKVLTHEQQIMQMLNERGISMSKSYQSNGMTANEMDGIMSKHFAKIQTNNTTFDRNGFRSWSEKNGNRTIQNNNRVSRTGFSV